MRKFVLIAALVFAAGMAACSNGEGEFEKSAAPATTADTLNKSADKQKTITFSLSSVLPAGSIWKVYDALLGGSALETIAATYKKTVDSTTGEPVSNLTLTAFSEDIAPMTYYVAVTEPDRAESDRLALTVSQ